MADDDVGNATATTTKRSIAAETPTTADGSNDSEARKRLCSDIANDDHHHHKTPSKECDALGVAFKRDDAELLFAANRRLYVYGHQLEPWWFKERANRHHPTLEPACRLTSNSSAAACGLSEHKLPGDLAREFLQMVDARAAIAGNDVSRVSTEYGHLHQERVSRLVNHVLFNNRVPMYEIGFVVCDLDEASGTSPDYLCMPFNVGASDDRLNSYGRPVVLEIKTSARRLLDTPCVDHIVQVHQQMHVLGWSDSFALLAAYHQDALAVWRVTFNQRLWDWIALRCALFLHIVNTVGAPHAYEVIRQCRLLQNVARDTHVYWFADNDDTRLRWLPLERVHLPEQLHRVERAFLDKFHPGWRNSNVFPRHCLSLMPPVKPTVHLVYKSPQAYDSEEDKRDAHGLVKREYWRHDLPLLSVQLAPHAAAYDAHTTSSPQMLAAYSALLCDDDSDNDSDGTVQIIK